MYVKLNLLVICAVLLNFSECKNCDDVFKCVTNWVVTALSPNSNRTVEIIEDLASNVATPNKSLDGNLFTGLTNLLADTFSSLVKESFSMNVIENKTKIYVQTFKINKSIFENKITNATSAMTPDLIDNINNDKYTLEDELRIPNINTEGNITPVMYKDLKKTTEINNKNNATVTIQRHTKETNIKTDTITKDSDGNKQLNNDGNKQLKYTTYDTNYINEQEKSTTSIPVNYDNNSKTNNFFDHTTDKTSITELTTMKIEITEHNNSDINFLRKTNIPVLDPISVDDPLKIDINVNYIADVYDGANEIDIGELVPDNLTDYLDIDYTDIYKDTTNEDIEYTPAIYIPTTTEAVRNIINKKPTDAIDSVYPWIATVFVMNGESKQFEYICDGILVSQRVVLTAARCVMKANVTVDVANILIILGKRSLQEMAPNEIVLRVNSIKVHDNFVSTKGKVENDLAIITLAEPVPFNDDVRPAPLESKDISVPLATATTGWHVSGPLQPLYLEPQSTENCMANSKNYLCATLGDSETTCPSYGGLLVNRQDDNQWRLKGIASGNPMSEGVCFNKHLTFTKIGNYLDWITEKVQESSKENNKS